MAAETVDTYQVKFDKKSIFSASEKKVKSKARHNKVKKTWLLKILLLYKYTGRCYTILLDSISNPHVISCGFF